MYKATTTLSAHVVTRMCKFFSQNGGQKHLKSFRPTIFVLHLHRVITIRLNVGKFSTKRFKTSANEGVTSCTYKDYVVTHSYTDTHT